MNPDLRRGITLLEVLIAMFVLAIGLMSVAALIPVGKFQMVEASKYDRSTATARGAMQELRVRGYVEPGNWQNYCGQVYPSTSTSGRPYPAWSYVAWVDVDEEALAAGYPGAMKPHVEYVPDTNPPVIAGGAYNISSIPAKTTLPPDGGTAATELVKRKSLGPLARGNAVCIDPYFLAANQNFPTLPLWTATTAAGQPVANDPACGVFPYPLKNDPQQNTSGSSTGWLVPDAWPNAPRMQRVTVSAGTGWLPPMRFPAARQAFNWQDEVVFKMSRDDAVRPSWLPTRVQGTVQSPIARQTLDDYSWFATIVPTSAKDSTSEMNQVMASVAVVYQRDVQFLQRSDVPSVWSTYSGGSLDEYQPVPGDRPAPAERMVYADILGSGNKGGLVRLRLPIDTSATPAHKNIYEGQPDKSDFSAVKTGQWIMLTAWTQENLEIRPGDTSDTLTLQYPPQRRAEFRWYRVTSAGTLNKGNLSGNDQWYQEVTLDGPDWNPDQYLDGDNLSSYLPHADSTGGRNGRTAYAILVRGVVAVYEQTIAIGQE